jgi:CubicO group peptidase (beta-lactamase class C family)
LGREVDGVVEGCPRCRDLYQPLMRFRLPQLARAVVVIAASVVSLFAVAASFDGVPRAFQPFVDQGEISGAVARVATKDNVLHLSVVGQSDLTSGRKLETNDLFWIASMTKPIAAACVALLVDDGKLTFDYPVDESPMRRAFQKAVEAAFAGSK